VVTPFERADDLQVAAQAFSRIDSVTPSSADDAVEHARAHWVRLVSRFLEMGEPMRDAMVAAARIVSFARTGPLVREGAQETRRQRPTVPPPGSGTRPRVRVE